jgi:hypothetical protein
MSISIVTRGRLGGIGTGEDTIIREQFLDIHSIIADYGEVTVVMTEDTSIGVTLEPDSGIQAEVEVTENVDSSIKATVNIDSDVE